MNDSTAARTDAIPSVSLCMIVRDAERSLPHALESARPFVQEMIVVDTGSTDGTHARAVELGARVFDFAWCDDFSAARNFSLEQATGQWIFWMDADDVLPAQSGHELRRRAAAHPRGDVAFWVTVEEETSEANGPARVMGHAHLKLFPRHPEIKFCYRVHEQVSPSLKSLGMQFVPTEAVVRHAHVDRSPAAESARAERNLRLCQLDLTDRGDDPFVLLNLGAAHLFVPGGLASAVACLQQSIAGFPRGSSTQLNAYLFLGQAHGRASDRNRERQAYREALAIFPHDAVLLLRLAGADEHLGLLIEAEQCYREALERGKVRVSSMHVRNGPALAVHSLGRIYLKTGRRVQAERLWERFLETSPGEPLVTSALSNLRLRAHSVIVSASAPP